MTERDVRHHARSFIIYHSSSLPNKCVNNVTILKSYVTVPGIRHHTFGLLFI